MRKRTFLDKKFSQGDSNSDAYRANWDATFAEPEPELQCLDCGAEGMHFCTFVFCPSEADNLLGGPTPQTYVGTEGETSDSGKDHLDNQVDSDKRFPQELCPVIAG